MRKISSFIMACAMCLSMTVVGTVAPQVAVQAEETAAVKEAPTETPKISDYLGQSVYFIQYTEGSASASAWVKEIKSIKVNGTDYKQASSIYTLGTDGYATNSERANIMLANAAFTKEINSVVISADGYKPLVLAIAKNYSSIKIHTNEDHKGGKATCKEKAVCDFCGEEYGDLADHTYTYESDGTYHWKKCQKCDATTEKEAHKGGTATTTKKAVCEVCGASYGDLKPVATTTVKNDTKPATQPAKKTVKAKKVVVNKKSIVLKKGKKAKLKAKLKPANATEKVTFKSSNKKVAKVTKNGVVKAVKKGKCKIIVKTASGKKAVVKVTVK